MTTFNRIDEFSRHPRKALFKLALPTITAMVVQTTYNMVDMVFVGRLGTASLAALTFSFPLYFILVSVNSGMGVGLNSLISRQLGAGEKAEAENSAMHGLGIALASALGLFLLFLCMSRPILQLLGAKEQVLELAVSYMNIIAAGSFFMFSSYAIHSTFTAQGDTLTPMKVQISGLLLNIILDPLFIFILKKGVSGAAIATIISQGCGLLLFTWYLRKKSTLQLSLKRFSSRLATVREIFKVGIPASLTMLLMAFYIMFLNRFMAHFGTEYVAAFGMASRLESAVVMPLVASAIALLTLTGMFHGAKQFPLLIKTFHFALKVNIIYALGMGILFFIFPTRFLGIFTSRADLLSIGAAYMRIEVFTFPLMAINITANRAMQGMGLGLPGITMNFIRIFVVAIPLAYVFVYLLNFGYLSIAIAMVCGGIAANLTALTWLRSIFGKLNQKEVEKEEQMLKFFKNILTQNSRGEHDTAAVEDELQLATCMLLLEVAHTDGIIQPQEELQIQTVIRKRFSLSEADSDKLIERARKDQAESVDLYPVTSMINRHWPTEEKFRLLENIWQIVYADGILDQHEDHLMHKLGTMLQLSHRQLIEAKLEAKKSIT